MTASGAHLVWVSAEKNPTISDLTTHRIGSPRLSENSDDSDDPRSSWSDHFIRALGFGDVFVEVRGATWRMGWFKNHGPWLLRGSGYLVKDSNQGYNLYKWVICPLTRVINLHITSY